MGLLGTLIGTALDVVTLPFDVIDDLGSTLEGRRGVAIERKILELGRDAATAVRNIKDVDPL